MEYIKIDVNRRGYSPKQVEDSLTVGELIEILEGLPSDLPVILNDSDYTFSNLDEDSIEQTTYED